MRTLAKTWLILSAWLPEMAWPHPGIGIVQDSRENIYYTDLKQVRKIDKQGNKTIVVPHVHTHELYIDTDDNLYGEHLWYNGERTDTWGHYVWKYSHDGQFSKVIPDREGFLSGFSFVRDHFGRMYWADRSTDCQRLARKNLDQTVSYPGDPCFKNIRWMTSTREGTIYLMDLFDLKKVDARGHVKTIATQLQQNNAHFFTWLTPQDPNLVMGIWLDNAENIYLAVAGGNVVKKITQDGKVTVAARTQFPWSPGGGMIDREGNLWVLEYRVGPRYEARVERFGKDGSRDVY